MNAIISKTDSGYEIILTDGMSMVDRIEVGEVTIRGGSSLSRNGDEVRIM